MARLNSFYFPTEYWPTLVGDTALLKGNEARHMLTVLRTETNQTVRLFDGEGKDGLFRVREISNKRALLEAVQLNQHPKPEAGVTLAIGWGKSKRRNYLFEKLVELKGEGVIFWKAQRSQGHLPNEPKDSWRDKCLQAAKQCGNPYLPTINTISEGVTGLIKFIKGFDKCYLAWESQEATAPLAPCDLAKGRTLVIIGPEGGLEDEEAAKLIENGVTPVTLGDSILRWETAATYTLSLGWFAKQE